MIRSFLPILTSLLLGTGAVAKPAEKPAKPASSAKSTTKPAAKKGTKAATPASAKATPKPTATPKKPRTPEIHPEAPKETVLAETPSSQPASSQPASSQPALAEAPEPTRATSPAEERELLALAVEAYPLTGKAAEGATAFKSGDYSRAVTALAAYRKAQPKDPYAYPLGYLQAKALLAQRQNTEAATLLEALLTQDGPLQSEVAYTLGSLYERQTLPEKARVAYGKVEPGSRRYDEARLAQLRLSPDLASASVALDKERFYWTKDHAEALSILLELAKKEGETEEARKIALKLFREYPGTTAGDAVAEDLSALSPAPEDLIARLSFLLEKKKGKEAAAFVKVLETKRGAEDAVVLEAKGDLAYFEREYKKAAELFERAKKEAVEASRKVDPGKPAVAVIEPYRATRRLGNALSRQGDTEGALALYREVYEAKTVEAPLALFDAARLLRDQDRLKEARALIDRAVDDYTWAPSRKEALWVSGWLAWRLGDDAAAAGRFEALLAATEDLSAEEREEEDIERRKMGFSTKERALYWGARASARAGRPAEAKARYERLVREFPLSYYSHQAFDRLRDLGDKELVASLRVRSVDSEPIAIIPRDPKGDTAVVSALPGGGKKKSTKPSISTSRWTMPSVEISGVAISDDESVRAATALIGLGMKAEAIDELKSQANQGRLSPDGGALLGALTLDEEGLSRSAWIMLWKWDFSRYPGAPLAIETGAGAQAKSRLVDLGWKLAYPRAYGELVDAYTTEFKVPSELVFAIMRAESTFRPEVVSPAKAVGLTQVLPSTAGWVAQKLLGGPKPSRAQLFDEATNLRLGSRFIAELVGLFDGNYALAIASYNAGPGAGMRWYRRWRDLDTDEIVEEIPFNETHGYTKKVLGSMGSYRYVWGDWSKEETRSLNLPRLLPAKLGTYGGKQF